MEDMKMVEITKKYKRIFDKEKNNVFKSENVKQLY